MAPKKRQSAEIQNYILNLFLIVFSLLLVLVLVPMFLGNLREEYKNTFYSLRPYVVTTDSMDPTIRPGALVVGRVVPFDEIKESDIITFEALIQGEESLNTHRVIKKDAAYLTTKGDNPLVVADVLPVTRTNLRYKVLVIWNGAAELRTARGLLLYVALPVLGAALLAGCVIAICGAVRRKKRRATRVDTQQDDEAAPWVPDTQQDDEAAPWVPGTQQDDEAAPQAPGTQQSDEAAPRVQRVQFDDDDDELLLQTTLLVAEVERQRKAAKKTKTKNADKEDLEWIKNYLK